MKASQNISVGSDNRYSMQSEIDALNKELREV